MRGGRILIIIGIIVLLGAIVVGVVLWMGARTASEMAETMVEELEAGIEGEEGVPYAPLLEGMQEIVVAAQNVPRGSRITSDAVQMAIWPEESVPDGALTDVEQALDRITRVDVVLDMPVTARMLTDEPGDLAAAGSDVALRIPTGKVAYALPVARYSSVAWALQPGDHVDVLISLLVVEMDEEFQAALPNNASCVQPPEGEDCRGGVMGRLEVLANGWVVNLTPGEQQRPRLVTQLTVQDATVLRVGDWPMEEEAEPGGEGEGEGEGEEEPQEGEEPIERPSRASVEPLTLIVTPQDAMVLKYAEELGANIDLVLRSAGDTDPVTTDSVTLQYIFDRFNVEIPPKLPYGVSPPLLELEPGAAGGVESRGGGEEVGE